MKIQKGLFLLKKEALRTNTPERFLRFKAINSDWAR